MKESLAQILSNNLGVRVCAFLRRSDYEDTWGSRLDRAGLKVKKNFDIADDDDFIEYKKYDTMIDGKYHWNPKGSFRGVKAGDSPADPPIGMIRFQKID